MSKLLYQLPKKRFHDRMSLLQTINNRTDFHLLTITFLWGMAVMLVDYQGNFPLNDDWSYGITVKRLVEEGTFDPTAWTSMSLISQTLWGSLFCYLFGFFFEVLRLSTLLLFFIEKVFLPQNN